MHPGLHLWLKWGEFLSQWHRYEVEGIERLDEPGVKMVVGYHGRSFAADFFCLNYQMYTRHGVLPVSIMHQGFLESPLGRLLLEGMEATTGDGPELERELAKGRHLFLLPGGTREAYRPWTVRYKVDWGRRLGYLRLALRHGLPIVPTASSGVDWTYIGLNDGYQLAKEAEKNNREATPWLGMGPLGLSPFSPPFPVKIRQVLGEPIDLEADGPVDPEDEERLLELHALVTGRVQSILDEVTADEWRPPAEVDEWPSASSPPEPPPEPPTGEAVSRADGAGRGSKP